MKILLNTSTSAMQFPVGGQEFTLLPRRSAHISQVQSIFAIVYDGSLDNASKDFIDRNVRRRYCIHGTVDMLEKLRPSQVLVIRNGHGAPLEQGVGSRSAELTLSGIKVRIPELFQDGSPAIAAPAAPSVDDISSKKPRQTRRAYVSRDGGYFETPWNQVKPGDTFMIREETGEYVEDGGEKEFVATGAAYVHGGLWTVPYVRLSAYKPAAEPASTEGIAIDTAKAGHSPTDPVDDGDDSTGEGTDEDDSADNDEEESDATHAVSGGVGAAKPPPVGGGARNRTDKSKRTKGQGRPAARR